MSATVLPVWHGITSVVYGQQLGKGENMVRRSGELKAGIGLALLLLLLWPIAYWNQHQGAALPLSPLARTSVSHAGLENSVERHGAAERIKSFRMGLSQEQPLFAVPFQ